MQSLAIIRKSTKGLAKPFLIIIVISIILLTVFGVIALQSNEKPSENSKSPDRESSIPASAIKMMPETDYYPPILHSDKYNQPIPLSNAINTAGGEDSPFITPDGNTLYFFFTPNVTVPPHEQLFDGVTGLYVSTKQNGAWATAQRIILQDYGKLALDGAECIQNDTMWFASAREGYDGLNYFVAEYINGKWTSWQYVGDRLMKEYNMGEMHITADQSNIYYHSDRAGGKGGLDIWQTQKGNNEWQIPINLQVLNTQDNEGWPFLTQNENELWFTRIYMGAPTIYKSTKLNGQWQEPELIISQFAGDPSIDSSGNIYFAHHYFNNESKMIESDIYIATKK